MADAHGVPAILSLIIPGLGQLVKGQIFKAIGIWVALAISSVMAYILIGLITTPIIYLWQIYDAYNN
jgi:TM2 domain-containing membrane protein YozV